MRHQLRIKRHATLWLAVLALLIPMCALAAVSVAAPSAGTPKLTEIRTEIGDNSISYPQLEGLADTDIQQAINNAIVEKANIAQRMVTLATLKNGATGLTVRYHAYLGAGILSVVIDAKGILDNGRNGQQYTALGFHLDTGEALTLNDLFTDQDAAVAYMEETLEATYLDELSSYLENSELSPLPTDQFTVDADGITFYYPKSRFSMLSGYAGAAQFNYDELTAYLRTGKDELPSKLGALPQKLSDRQIRQSVTDMAAQGSLPHVPAKLGDAMTDLIGRYRLLREPDQYPGGRYCQFEAPMFRRVLVLTDALTNGFDSAIVEGLMSFRADLYGIKTGVTTQKRWQEILGAPDHTVAYDETLAFDYGLPVGTADYYTLGGHQLLLYADGSGTLFAVRLTQ